MFNFQLYSYIVDAKYKNLYEITYKPLYEHLTVKHANGEKKNLKKGILIIRCSFFLNTILVKLKKTNIIQMRSGIWSCFLCKAVTWVSLFPYLLPWIDYSAGVLPH